MIVKWFIWGAILGAAFGLFAGGGSDGIFFMAIVGGAGGIAIRKWFFRTFWK